MTPIDPDTSRWVELVTGTRLERAEALVGGLSSEVHRCWFADGSTFVVRHITDRVWLDREPDLIRHEALALELLAQTNVPAPRLVASDATAGRLLMTVVDGAVRATEHDVRSRTVALAQAAARIAAVPLPMGHGMTTWRSWVPDDLRPPDWGDQALWQTGIAAFRAQDAPISRDPHLLHRDFHPLNVLWGAAGVSGVVDWVNACVGHAHAELGHCRWNLAVLADVSTADMFLAEYVEFTGGQAYDRWWDVAAVMGLLPGPIGTSAWRAVGRHDLTDRRVIEATEAFLRSALNAGR